MHLKFLPSFILLLLTSSNPKPYLWAQTQICKLLYTRPSSSSSSPKAPPRNKIQITWSSTQTVIKFLHKNCRQISFSSNVYNRPTITAPESRNVLHEFDVHIHIQKLLDSLMTPFTIWNMGLAQQSPWISVKFSQFPHLFTDSWEKRGTNLGDKDSYAWIH